MREHILAFHFDEDLINRLHNKRVVVITSDFDKVHHICKSVNDRQNSLHCLAIQHKGSLASIPFHESWRNIPMAIFANEMGPFKEMMGKLPLLRELSTRIFLNTANVTNFTNLHILASLGIDCGVSFDENNVDWEAMNDLMTYAVYSKVNHASVEPFQYIAQSYDPSRFTEFSSVYFDNPQTYLYIDKDENIALNSKDLKQGKFIAKGLDALPGIHENEKFTESLHAWQAFFLKEDGCAYCQAWRVCLGKFSETYDKNPGCRQFFADLMEAADHFRASQHQNKRKELWQP